MDVPEIKYETDDFSDILRKDARFDSRAYDFVLQVISEATASAKGHVTGAELLDWFRDLALDAYGPMAYAVLTDWVDADFRVLEFQPALGVVRFRVAEGKDKCVEALFFRPFEMETNIEIIDRKSVV